MIFKAGTYSADRMVVRCRPKRFLNLADQQKWQAFPHSPEPELTGSDAGEYRQQKNRSCVSKRKAYKRKRSWRSAFRRSPQKPLLAVPGTCEAILFSISHPTGQKPSHPTVIRYILTPILYSACVPKIHRSSRRLSAPAAECIRRFGKETPEPEKEQPRFHG